MSLNHPRRSCTSRDRRHTTTRRFAIDLDKSGLIHTIRYISELSTFTHQTTRPRALSSTARRRIVRLARHRAAPRPRVVKRNTWRRCAFEKKARWTPPRLRLRAAAGRSTGLARRPSAPRSRRCPLNAPPLAPAPSSAAATSQLPRSAAATRWWSQLPPPWLARSPPTLLARRCAFTTSSSRRTRC